MMYNSGYVAAIKSNGKIVREFGDKVYIPFGSEYTIFLKNPTNVKALVHVYIDGECVTSGGIVISGNSSLDLKRAVNKGNTSEGNAFKFIEMTDKIHDNRGSKAEDGIVRVVFQREVPQAPTYFAGWPPGFRTVGVAHAQLLNEVSCNYSNSALRSHGAVQLSAQSSVPQNDAGITVPGSVVQQTFSTVSGLEFEDDQHTMSFRLVGDIGQQKVQEAVTVQRKVLCITCNTTNSQTAKFCNECGTSLIIC